MPVTAQSYHLETDESIYVIGNVVGELGDFRKALQAHSLIDEDNQWTGGKTQLVILGDVLSKSSLLNENNQQTIDLLQHLQKQASLAGGGSHLLLGEHEIMALTNESSEEDPGQPLIETPAGRWLASQPFVIAINRELFTHAGLAHSLQFKTLQQLNRELSQGLRDYSQHWQYFVNNDWRKNKVAFSKRFDFVESLTESEARSKFLKLRKNNLFNDRSPVFYQGNTVCHPFYEESFLVEKLDQLKVDRLWVSHTAGEQQTIQTRFNGQLIMLANYQGASDANAEHLKSRFRLAKISPQKTFYGYNADSLQALPVSESPMRVWPRPYEMSDDEIAEFLQTATITSQAETLEGRTKPLQITLEKNGKKLKGIFKFINQFNRRYRIKYFGAGDRFQHELAAYHIDRMLGLNLVPVTVEREVDGQQGTVQLWIDNMASALQINEGEVDYNGECDVMAQENMMNVFDYLIMNFDRNQSNIVFTKHDWQIWFIDHTRSFGIVLQQPPYQGGVELIVTERFNRALKSLDLDKLQTLKTWLRREQMDTLWTRRNRLLNGTYASEVN